MPHTRANHPVDTKGPKSDPCLDTAGRKTGETIVELPDLRALPLLAVATKTYLAQYEFYSEYFPARGETVSENQNLCSYDD
jgi:hypothetical protein